MLAIEVYHPPSVLDSFRRCLLLAKLCSAELLAARYSSFIVGFNGLL